MDPTSTWTPVDPLGETLHFLRLTGTLYCRSEFTAPWGLALPPLENCLMFHVVTAGRCWLETEGVEPVALKAGDLALVPHGEGHRLVSEPGALAPDLFDLPRDRVSECYELLRHGGGGEAASLVCGVARFDGPAARHLVALLPRIITLEASRARQPEWVRSTLRFMAEEAGELRPGGETVITRLADVLVIQLIRSWMEEDPAARTGWLGALRDRQIGRAILLMHREPARPWTLASLAAEVAMSRSAFAARFTELVGEPAMHYLARWRMQVAWTWLREGDAGLAELASRLGYQSEAAFSRAFKRFIGSPPGAVRRRAAGRDGPAAAGLL
ncbi:MAG TPA: AraC family transcriptional regulator [Gemmatimonadales bacterium]